MNGRACLMRGSGVLVCGAGAICDLRSCIEMPWAETQHIQSFRQASKQTNHIATSNNIPLYLSHHKSSQQPMRYNGWRMPTPTLGDQPPTSNGKKWTPSLTSNSPVYAPSLLGSFFSGSVSAIAWIERVWWGHYNIVEFVWARGGGALDLVWSWVKMFKLRLK